MSAHVDDNYIYLVDSPSLCWIVSYAINPTLLMSPPFSSAMQPINATNPIPLCHRAGSVLCNPCDIMANGSLSFWMFRFCWSWPTASCSVIDRCMPAFRRSPEDLWFHVVRFLYDGELLRIPASDLQSFMHLILWLVPWWLARWCLRAPNDQPCMEISQQDMDPWA